LQQPLPGIASGDDDDDNEDSDEQLFQCLCGGHKTFEKLACKTCGILQHAQCADYQGPAADFDCAHCSVKKLHTSGATLVVAPDSILPQVSVVCAQTDMQYCVSLIPLAGQWLEEIEMHTMTNRLRVYHYVGVRNGQFVRPSNLAANDLVVTSYSVLAAEVHHQFRDTTQRQSSRYVKKFVIFTFSICELTFCVGLWERHRLWWRWIGGACASTRHR
jgi:hypothetical protein